MTSSMWKLLFAGPNAAGQIVEKRIFEFLVVIEMGVFSDIDVSS